nr:hypothetical protein [Tanacetum cinerariifolium]
MVENASGATSINVPSAGKTTASLAEGEKNTKDADANLKDELVDLLGKNVVPQYYTKKEDGSDEVISNLKESRADDIPLKVKLEDLSDILKDKRSNFFTPDSPSYEPIIVLDESKKEEEVERDKDTKATSYDAPKDTSAPPPPSLKSAQFKKFLNLQIQVYSVQEKLNILDSLPSLLHKVFDTLNRFTTMVENASGATSINVPSAGKTTASLAEGEKNTKDADANLKDKLVDILGKNVVPQYYTKKEDGSDEIISNLKVSDLHLEEWREVIQACLDKSEKRWKTIYDLVKTRLDQLTQTDQELKIDLNKPLKEQDPLNELNELANKKRKRTSDLKDPSRSTKKHKSSSLA